MTTTLFRHLIASDRGATAIEYGLIAALLALAAVGAMSTLGGSVREKYETVDTAVHDATTP